MTDHETPLAPPTVYNVTICFKDGTAIDAEGVTWGMPAPTCMFIRFSDGAERFFNLDVIDHWKINP